MKFIQLALACAVPILTLVACTRERPPNVLLVTIDTLRPDSLGFIGGHNDTPTLDGLAASGHAFSGAISPVPLTLPAHTAILSGKLPHRNGVHDNGQTVPADLPLLQETLRRGLRQRVSAAKVVRAGSWLRSLRRRDDAR